MKTAIDDLQDIDGKQEKELPTIFARDMGIDYKNRKPTGDCLTPGDSWVIATTGIRGSGKSLALVWWTIQALMRGLKVWTNMPVAFKVLYPNGDLHTHRTQPLDFDALYQLDRQLENGVVILDELQYYLDSRTSVGIKQRLVLAVLNQIRHRNLDFYFSVKDVNMIDKRLRNWELDVEIQCWDKSRGDKSKPKGHYFQWNLYDHSGAWTGKKNLPEWGRDPTASFELKYGDKLWPCYDTHEVIDYLDALRPVKAEFDERVVGDKSIRDRERMEGMAEIVSTLCNQGVKEIKVDEFVIGASQALGIEANAMSIGRDLMKLGVKRKLCRGGNVYVINE